MRTLTIQIDNHEARCEMRHGAFTHQAVLPLEHVTSWGNLLQQVKDELQLDQRPPPGMLTQADAAGMLPQTVRAAPWQPRHFTGTATHEGWAWGFWYPAPRHETCCGFVSREAAERAASILRTNLDRLRGDWPGGTYEVFSLDEAYAFLDSNGDIHATFPTARDALAAAGKHQQAMR